MLELAVLFLLVAGAKKAWDDTWAAWDRSRKAYMKRAKKHYPHMSKPQRAAHALRHDLGYGLSQVLHGFPTARHGFAQGWNEGREAHVQARTARERAQTGHAEAHAGALGEWQELRRRRKEALEEISRQQAREGSEGNEGTSPAAPPAAYCGYCGTPDHRQCPPHCATWTRDNPYPGREDGPTYSYGPESATAGWPAATVEQAHYQAQRMAGDDPWVVTEYPPGGGPGTTITTYRDGRPVPPGETAAPQNDCMYCGLPLAGEHDGWTHKRCEEVVDADREANYVRDNRPLEEVEASLRDQGKCSHQIRPNGWDGGAIYCGQPVDSEGGEFCPHHRAEASGDDEGAAEELWEHTRALLGRQDRNQPAPTTEGTTSMSDVTYDDVTSTMGLAVQNAETRTAEVGNAMAAAEAHAQDLSAAKAHASSVADEMQGLNMDPATLGAMADHIDALDEAEKAHQHVQEAQEAARKTSVRVQETAQHVVAALARGHAGLKAAHDDAPVEAADRAFYQG